jgi:hypothetical protein
MTISNEPEFPRATQIEWYSPFWVVDFEKALIPATSYSDNMRAWLNEHLGPENKRHHVLYTAVAFNDYTDALLCYMTFAQ